MFDFVIIRQNMLAEVYGAYIWQQFCACGIITTPPLVKLDESVLEKITGKNVLIVGRYYRNNMDEIVKVAKDVSVFFNESDELPKACNYACFKASKGQGFTTWTLDQTNYDEEHQHVAKIAEYLDEYLYGFPSEEALCFQNGVYTIDKPTDLEKILTIQGSEDIKSTILRGKQKRTSNLRIAEQRAKCAAMFLFTLDDGDQFEALVTIGDSPIVDTCILLSEMSPTGIGMSFRYDVKNGKTLISMRVTKESGLDAGLLMSKYIGGGGSQAMGGGSISFLVFPINSYRRPYREITSFVKVEK